jgi:CRISPR-associated protein Csd1
MLLERLREYSERLDLPPTMYDKMRIKWLIDLDLEGRFLGFVQTEGTGKKNDRGKEYMAPHVGKTSGVKARLLAENGEYVLGIARDPQKRAKVAERHQKFVMQARKCAITTKEPVVEAVLRFLDNLDLTKLRVPSDLNPAHNLTFRVEGTLPITLKSVQEYWSANATSDEDHDLELNETYMECLICGELKQPVRRLQFKIKRIPGKQTSSMVLISANQKAFESYGLEESLIAPTCRDCGERFSKAANALIEDERTHITVGPLVYLFWTKDDLGFSMASLLSRPEPDEVRALIASAFSGQRIATEAYSAPFYATAFSASGSRVVVRDWLETTVEDAKRNLARWFQLQAIIGDWGDPDAPPFPIQGYFRRESNYWVEGLVECVVPKVKGRRDTQRLNPNIPRTLLQMALKGGSLPLGILIQTVKRIQAEQGVTRNQAALIKMVLLSWQPDVIQEGTMYQLDASNQNASYLCGRLLAVLETIQREAIPSAKATIIDRFFGTASSAPASVFGKLIRGMQPHLGKLRKERRATYEALARKLEEIQVGLCTFPKVLTLEEQGRFALGYYHQRASDRAEALARRQSAQDGKISPEPRQTFRPGEN